MGDMWNSDLTLMPKIDKIERLALDHIDRLFEVHLKVMSAYSTGLLDDMFVAVEQIEDVVSEYIKDESLINSKYDLINAVADEYFFQLRGIKQEGGERLFMATIGDREAFDLFTKLVASLIAHTPVDSPLRTLDLSCRLSEAYMLSRTDKPVLLVCYEMLNQLGIVNDVKYRGATEPSAYTQDSVTSNFLQVIERNIEQVKYSDSNPVIDASKTQVSLNGETVNTGSLVYIPAGLDDPKAFLQYLDDLQDKLKLQSTEPLKSVKDGLKKWAELEPDYKVRYVTNRGVVLKLVLGLLSCEVYYKNNSKFTDGWTDGDSFHEHAKSYTWEMSHEGTCLLAKQHGFDYKEDSVRKAMQFVHTLIQDVKKSDPSYQK
uniref:Uncharacterized protein n=1 Tax=Vibrio sp. 09022 TaxID=452804 RepID=A9M536_9VIBR|nr:hypothetical protein [Vibrio sp. 09022]ABX77151.1 hypothetical protein BMSF_0009 [Vibrio sp. 09022]